MTDEPVGSRLLSLDAFRGLTIAGMLLVNNPGSWAHLYPPLAHAEWHGWTPTDLIFPFFLFIVGISLTLSFGRRLTEGRGATRADLVRKVVVRGAVIFALGMILSGFPFYRLATIRIMGVLQRIGVVYVATGLVFLFAGVRAQRRIALGLLLGYWLALLLVPVPGYGAGILERQGNLAQYIDQQLLGAHRWLADWDPEGLLSTLPAIATCLLGVECGRWIRGGRPPRDTALGLFVVGNLAMLAGVVWGIWFPINKNLWTSSYALFTGGMACYLFGLLYWIVDARGHRAWSRFFVIYGRNAILVFVASGLLARTLALVKVSGPEGVAISLQAWLHRTLLASWLPLYPASLAYAVGNVLFWYAVLRELDRRGIYLKV